MLITVSPGDQVRCVYRHRDWLVNGKTYTVDFTQFYADGTLLLALKGDRGHLWGAWRFEAA